MREYSSSKVQNDGIIHQVSIVAKYWNIWNKKSLLI